MWTDRKADSRRLNEPVKAIAASRVSEVTRDIRARVVPHHEEEKKRRGKRRIEERKRRRKIKR